MSEVVSWVDADGEVTTLPVEWRARGRFMPKVIIQSDKVPGQAGSRPRQVRHDDHEFLLPLFWQAASDVALRTDLRDLIRKMNPANDDGTPRYGKVRVVSPVGDVREITCLYTAGLELDETVDDASGLTWQRAAVSFLAHDPYWYDASPVSSPVWTITDTPNFFPILPISLTASELVVAETITNAGDVQAWPVWTITGPGSLVKLSNLSTGQTLYFPSLSLGIGQFLTIDTRPGVKSVLLNDGTNAYSLLEPTSALWPLRSGANQVRLEMSGVDATDSSLQVTYYQRFLSP
ncbi:phage distal tail protein [Actinophytocola sp. NPDC049390]|uniref:phage distal tail protein n=1 Tax=Actinophytocola sp. NPDC049390 TaxID=3363894 RepID=UPI00379456D6